MTILKILEQHLYGGFLLVAVGLYFYHAIKREGDRKWMIECAEQNLGAKFYKAILKSALDKLDCIWSGRYLSWRLYDFNLMTSVVYTIGFMVIFWLIQNAPAKIGGVTILAPSETWRRLLVIISFCVFVFLYLSHRRYSRQNQTFKSIWILFVSFAVSVGVVASVLVSGAGDVAFTFVIIGVGAGLVTVLVAGETKDRAVIGAVTVVFSFSIALGDAVGDAVGDAFHISVSIVGSFVLMMVVFFALVLFFRWLVVWRSYISAYIFINLGVFILIVNFIFFFESTDFLNKINRENTVTMLIFCGAFPVINAAFDFVSYGLTRWFLRVSLCSAEWKSIFISLFDFIVACILLIVVTIFITMLFQGVNYLSGIKIYDLEEMFLDIKNNSQDYLWLYAMLLSTLLPTFIHFLIATFSFITLIPQWFWNLMSNCVKGYEESLFKHIGAALGYTAATSFTFALPCIVIWYAWKGIGLIMNQSNLETILNFLEIFIF